MSLFQEYLETVLSFKEGKQRQQLMLNDIFKKIADYVTDSFKELTMIKISNGYTTGTISKFSDDINKLTDVMVKELKDKLNKHYKKLKWNHIELIITQHDNKSTWELKLIEL